MTNDECLENVYQSLSEFIIHATKEDAPSHAVQALPEVVKALIELTVITRVRS